MSNSPDDEARRVDRAARITEPMRDVERGATIAAAVGVFLVVLGIVLSVVVRQWYRWAVLIGTADIGAFLIVVGVSLKRRASRTRAQVVRSWMDRP